MQGTLVLTDYSAFEEQCRRSSGGLLQRFLDKQIKAYNRFYQHYYNSKLHVYNSNPRLKQRKQMRRKQCQN